MTKMKNFSTRLEESKRVTVVANKGLITPFPQLIVLFAIAKNVYVR